MKPVKFVPFYKPKDTPSKPRTFACESCRKKKIKCSSTRPACENCLKRGIACIYKETPVPSGTRPVPSTVSESETHPDRTRSVEKGPSGSKRPSLDEGVSLPVVPSDSVVVQGKELAPWSIQDAISDPMDLSSTADSPPAVATTPSGLVSTAYTSPTATPWVSSPVAGDFGPSAHPIVGSSRLPHLHPFPSQESRISSGHILPNIGFAWSSSALSLRPDVANSPGHALPQAEAGCSQTDPKSAQACRTSFNLTSLGSHSLPSSPTLPSLGSFTHVVPPSPIPNPDRLGADKPGGLGDRPFAVRYARQKITPLAPTIGRTRDTPHLTRHILKVKPLTLSGINPVPQPGEFSRARPSSDELPPVAMEEDPGYTAVPRLPSLDQVTQGIINRPAPVLPPPIEHQLFTDFFEFVYPQVPLFHRPRLEYQISHGQAEPVLLFALYAVATRFSKRPQAVLTDGFSASEAPARQARRLLEDTRAPPSLSSLQAMIIMSIFELSAGNKSAGTMYCQQAISACQRWGFVAGPPAGETIPVDISSGIRVVGAWMDQEVRKRLWWTCIVVSICIARCSVKPSSITADMVPPTFPCPEWLWGQDQTTIQRFFITHALPTQVMTAKVPACFLEHSRGNCVPTLRQIPSTLLANDHSHLAYLQSLRSQLGRVSCPGTPVSTTFMSSPETVSSPEEIGTPTMLMNRLTFVSHNSPPTHTRTPSDSIIAMSCTRGRPRLDLYSHLIALLLVTDKATLLRYHLRSPHVPGPTQLAEQFQWLVSLHLVWTQCFHSDLVAQCLTMRANAIAPVGTLDHGRRPDGTLSALTQMKTRLLGQIYDLDKDNEAEVVSLILLLLGTLLELSFDVLRAYDGNDGYPDASDPGGGNNGNSTPTASPLCHTNELRQQAWNHCIESAYGITWLFASYHDVQVENVYGYVPHLAFSVQRIMAHLRHYHGHDVDKSGIDFDKLALSDGLLDPFQRYWNTNFIDTVDPTLSLWRFRGPILR
ncbi:hypothetical protein IWQ62_003082 [Dispira parvispora]|uniref:Zn(2)-C6 fungal-type domain-containing protein n=1 Tax=Dispira parvispora TaxID=1520584 RepID=A0A9W8E211_9FUNG|nr:hypothetical protein IWQ62_003082 [Dispira parvispora]